MDKDNIRIGDEVIWRGSWGSDSPKRVTVTGLEVTQEERSKHGEPVEETSWSNVLENKCIVSVSSGNWAYGEQIQKPEPPNSIKLIGEENIN